MQTNFSSTLIPLMQSVQQQLQKNLETEQKLIGMMALIADFFEADVATSYISIDDNYLEFLASNTTLSEDKTMTVRFGEGICGRAAASGQVLSLNKEENSPFALEIAAPLMQFEQVIGVMSLGFYQTKVLSDDDIETIKTIAMFLTTIFSTPEIVLYKRKIAKMQGISLQDRFKGTTINKGYGVGLAVVHKRQRAVQTVFAMDIQKEQAVLEQAKEKMLADFDLKIKNNTLGTRDHLEILETYKLLAQDKGWYKKINAYIQTGLTAEAAIEKTYDDMQSQLANVTDIYLKERLSDLRDISDRLRTYITGRDQLAQSGLQDIILIAQSMGPADLTDYNPRTIRGLVLEEGTSTMHVAIVAKALNIPVVTKIKGLYREIKEGSMIAIDGQGGFVYVNPSFEMQTEFKKRQKKMMQWRDELKQIAPKKSQTLDRRKISLNLNIGLDFDMEYIDLSNCDGIGLYRTEIAFMTASQMPSVDEQVSIYQKLLSKTEGKRVIFRSLDVGSDKLLPYWGTIKEANPAIGWRSIRITLDRRALLRAQMKALLKATQGRELAVMFPMIANLEEFLSAKETLMLEYQKQKEKGLGVPSKIKVGLMIEVPSVIFELDEILPHADFISVGTNDLAQFIFASDRTNPNLMDRYDVLSAPFLKVMQQILIKAQAHNVLCGVCGEMASVPIEALALIGLGYQHLSCAGSAFATVKKMVRSVRAGELADYINTLLKSGKKTLRPQLKAYAKDHGIAI
ncbi:MAG: phosphoenolpyruvate--protein phosphotransferase [Alphaproteobacteria bacterium]|nr:phosphoenolpyruvate--protein phosphotransferase [Alphaproteobacteria bacterium]